MSWNYDLWLQSSSAYEEFISEEVEEDTYERDEYQEYKDNHFEEWERERGYR